MNIHSTFSNWVELDTELLIPSIDNLDFYNLDRLLECKVYRDSNYKLMCTMIGERSNFDNEDSLQSPKINKGITILGHNNYGTVDFTLEKCFLLHEQVSLKENLMEITLTFKVEQIKKAQTSLKESDGETLIEWYLNGTNNIVYPLITKTKFESFTYLQRSGIDDENPRKVAYNNTENSSYNYALIDCGEFKCILFSLDKKIGPDWSINIGIEYRKEWGIPSPETRVSVSEILSFIMGTQLLNVGYSFYDSNYYIIDAVSINPWGDNVVSRCRSSKQTLIGLEYDDIAYEQALELSELASQYIKIKDELRLNDVLWRYWIAKEMPIGTNLPILASGLEILVNTWLKSSFSKKEPVYMKKSAYHDLIENNLLELEKTLSSYNFKEKIINKLKSAYNMGVNEKINVFFDEVSISPNDLERRAIRARNDMVHGSAMKSEQQVFKAIEHTKAYTSLFERIILTILNYKGLYVDRFNNNHEIN